MAVCRAGAAEAELPLHEHIAVLAGNSADNTSVPVPMFNIINGGLHCGGGANAIQELMVMPVGAESIGEAMELGYGVQALIRDKLAGMSSTNVLEVLVTSIVMCRNLTWSTRILVDHLG